MSAPDLEPAYEDLLELMQAFILEMELLEEANKETAPALLLKRAEAAP